MRITGSATSGLQFGFGTSNPSYFMDIFNNGGSNTDLFRVGNNSPAPNALVVTKAGNIGIGTATPSSTLSVASGAAIGSSYVTGVTAPANGLIVQGNVGIGTTTPGAQLHVSSTGFSTTGVRITVNDTASWTAANPFLIETQDGIARFKVSPTGTTYIAGNVGIGTATPTAALTVVGDTVASKIIEVHNNFAVGENVYTHSDTDFRGPAVNLLRSRGSQSAPTAVQSGDTFGYIGGGGYDGTGYFPAAQAVLKASENWSTSAHGTDYTFWTTNNGSINLQQQMVITNAGNVGIGTTAPWSRVQIVGSDTTAAHSALNVNNSASTSLLFVRNDGNVGIGTTTPGAQLHVSSTGFSTTGVRITVNPGGTSANSNPFLVEDSTGAHLFRVNATGTVFSASNYNCALAANCYVSNQAADLAELTAVVGSASDYQVGDLVRQSPGDQQKVEKTFGSYDSGAYGIVTDRGQFLGNNPNLQVGVNAVKVALVGYVKAKVSTRNGAVKPGDYLAASPRAGVAMKATTSGRVIGIAREPLDTTQDIGTIEILVQPTYFAGYTGLSATDTLTSAFSNITVDYSVLPPETRDFFLANIIQPFQALGIEIEQGLIKVAHLIANIVDTKLLRTDNIEVASPALDRSFMPVGASMALVENPAVKSTSEVFLSPKGKHPTGSWSVSDINDGSFYVYLSEPATENTEFTYWIIQKAKTDASLTPLPEPPLTVYDISSSPSPASSPPAVTTASPSPEASSTSTGALPEPSPTSTVEPSTVPSPTSSIFVSPTPTPSSPSTPEPTPTPNTTP
jgi:hypothetical protein